MRLFISAAITLQFPVHQIMPKCSCCWESTVWMFYEFVPGLCLDMRVEYCRKSAQSRMAKSR